MANRYDGDDREDVIKEQSGTDPSSTDDHSSVDQPRGHDQEPEDAPPGTKTA